MLQIALLCLVLFAVLSSTLALDNGLALTPPMGWLTWGRFMCITDCKKYPNECISDQLIRRTARKMVDDGYLEAGYDYIGIDDCWMEKKRGPNGRLVPDKERFPHGMLDLSNYIHSLGLKFGIYEDYGIYTCAGYPGVLNHEQTDIDTFVDWGADYIKLDGCYYDDITKFEIVYSEFGQKLNASGRPILYSCSWPVYQEDANIKPNYTALAEHCNLWRNWVDIGDSWASVTRIMNWFGDNQERFAKNAGPGHWNDPDMLIIGNDGFSVDQAKVQIAVWAVMAAPLLMSVDLDTIGQEFKEILLNREVIAINQDSLGKQGLRVWQNKDYKKKLTKKEKANPKRERLPPVRKAQGGEELRTGLEVWTRELSEGSFAVAFVSQRDDGTPFPATFNFQEIGVPNQDYDVEDLYGEGDDRSLTAGQEFEVRINPTGVKFYKFTPTNGEEKK